jgi:Tfp pilus assembly protein FimT
MFQSKGFQSTGFRSTGFQSTRNRSHGISVLEILIALGVLAVIISFVSTSFGTITDKAELKATVEEVNFSIQSARNTARKLETDVIMHLKTGQPEEHDSISFSLPSRNADLGPSGLLPEFQLPADIHLVADEASIHFDSRGLVETPVRLLLVSNADENVNERLLVQ